MFRIETVEDKIVYLLIWTARFQNRLHFNPLLSLSVDTDDKRGSRWFISNYVLNKKSQSFKAQRMMIDKRFIIGSIFIIVCQAKNNPIEGGQELLAARAVITYFFG